MPNTVNMEEHWGSEPPGAGWTYLGAGRWVRDAALVGGGAAAPAGPRPQPPGDGPRIAVIGGGPGGLFATYILNQRMPGARVTIFEASACVGGKVRTEEFDDGTPFEAGVAELYEYSPHDGVGDPLRLLIERDLGLRTVDIGGGGVILRDEVLADLDALAARHGEATRARVVAFHNRMVELMPLDKYAQRWQPDNEHPWADKTFRECATEELRIDGAALAVDAGGRQHRGKGAGGGQFVKGSSGSADKPSLDDLEREWIILWDRIDKAERKGVRDEDGLKRQEELKKEITDAERAAKEAAKAKRNARPTFKKLTEKAKAAAVRTKEFKSWFGDWESDPANASKVVDKTSGKPQETHGMAKKVYHGSGAIFDTFDKNKQTTITVGLGFYFAEDRRVADMFSAPEDEDDDDDEGVVYECYLNIRRPLDLDTEEGMKLWEDTRASLAEPGELEHLRGSKSVNAAIQKMGYDGIVHSSDMHSHIADPGGEYGRVWIAFEPNQIKSTDNAGTFDPTNDNIHLSVDNGAVDEVALEYVEASVHSDLATEPWTCNGLNGIKNVLMDNDEYMQLYHVVGGIERVVEALAGKLAARVSTCCRVTEVRRVDGAEAALAHDVSAEKRDEGGKWTVGGGGGKRKKTRHENEVIAKKLHSTAQKKQGEAFEQASHAIGYAKNASTALPASARELKDDLAHVQILAQTEQYGAAYKAAQPLLGKTLEVEGRERAVQTDSAFGQISALRGALHAAHTAALTAEQYHIRAYKAQRRADKLARVDGADALMSIGEGDPPDVVSTTELLGGGIGAATEAAGSDLSPTLRANVGADGAGGPYRVCYREVASDTITERCEEFDAVVVCLPNHWLRSIRWHGSLRDAIHETCAHYDLPAHYLRVSMLFKERWWADLGLPGEFWMMDALGGCCVYDESARWAKHGGNAAMSNDVSAEKRDEGGKWTADGSDVASEAEATAGEKFQRAMKRIEELKAREDSNPGWLKCKDVFAGRVSPESVGLTDDDLMHAQTTKTTRDVDPSKLIATQGGIKDWLVEEKLNKPDKRVEEEEGGISVVHKDGKDYIIDGHHSAAAAVLRGDSTVKARYHVSSQSTTMSVTDEEGTSGGHVLSILLAGGDALLLCSSDQDDEEVVDYVMENLPAPMRDGAQEHLVDARVDRFVGSINAQPGGYPAEELRGEHVPDAEGNPGVLLCGDYFFDSTMNAALMSANTAVELLLEHLGADSAPVTPAIEALESKDVGLGLALALDASGHAHRGKGEGGGQFVKGGAGDGAGGGADGGPAADELFAKVPAARGPMMEAVRDGKGKEARVLLKNGRPAPDHIGAGMVPPGWEDVMVSLDPDADLLVTAVDSKGRDKRVYNNKFHMRNAALKFSRVDEMVREGPRIDAEIQAARKNARTKDVADCAWLMATQATRPGSAADTGAKVRAYGATTLEGRHITQDEAGVVRLDFIGKEGVAHHHVVRDPALAKMLVERSDRAGAHGQLFGVSEGQVNKFIGALDGGHFSAKDFRTRRASLLAVEEMAKFPGKPATAKEYKARVKMVAERVSDVLGNRPAQALESYINPAVFSSWRVDDE